MTIERAINVFAVYCDSCPEGTHFYGDDWQDLMDGLREDGWTKRNVDGEWLHFCAECSQEEQAV